MESTLGSCMIYVQVLIFSRKIIYYTYKNKLFVEEGVFMSFIFVVYIYLCSKIAWLQSIPIFYHLWIVSC